MAGITCCHGTHLLLGENQYETIHPDVHQGKFPGCHVNDFPWPQKTVEYDSTWRAASSVGLCSQPQPGALTPGKQETGLPVMQRLPRGPQKGSPLALFERGSGACPSAPLAPDPQGTPRLPGALELVTFEMPLSRAPAQRAATEDIRGEVGMIGWASHPPRGLF